jgi:hypothetical protein
MARGGLSTVPSEQELVEGLLPTQEGLKYNRRDNIPYRAALEATSPPKLEPMKHLTLTDPKFQRLLEEAVYINYLCIPEDVNTGSVIKPTSTFRKCTPGPTPKVSLSQALALAEKPPALYQQTVRALETKA